MAILYKTGQIIGIQDKDEDQTIDIELERDE